MKGLAFTIVYCALSLLIAATLSTLFIDLGIIHANEENTAHSAIMLCLFIIYIGLSLHFSDDLQDSKQNDNGVDK
jgi:hypothetical protein